MDPTRCLLARHASTAWNLAGRYQSRSDIPLMEGSEDEIADLSVRLFDEGIHRVWVSPATRARQTAEGIASRLGIAADQLVETEELEEVDFGDFEGLTGPQLASGPWSRRYAAWRRVDAGAAPPPNGETWEHAAERASGLLRRVAEAGGTTLLVGHSYLLRLIVRSILPGMPPQGIRHLRMDNARFTELCLDTERWVLARHNV